MNNCMDAAPQGAASMLFKAQRGSSRNRVGVKILGVSFF